MKTTKLVAVLGVATFATAILGTTVVQAADPDLVTATTKGSVEFVKNEETAPGGGVVDPGTTDPTDPKPIIPPVTPEKPEPTKPVTPPPGLGGDDDLSIIAFTNFDFGTHYVDTNAVKYNAIFDKDYGKWTLPTNQPEGVTPPAFSGVAKDGVFPNFIQIQQSEKVASPWTLKANLSEFTSGAKKLNGPVTISLQPEAYHQAGTVSATVKPAALDKDKNIVLSADGEDSAELITSNGTPGASINSVVFGSLSDTPDAETFASLIEDKDPNSKTGYSENKGATGNLYYNNGVTLNLPIKSNMEKDTKYTADLTWTVSYTQVTPNP